MSRKFPIRHRSGKLALAVLAAALTLTPGELAGATSTSSPGPRVTVRVEGRYRTLLWPTPVTVHAGWITKNKAPKGACSAKSGAGALNDATKGDWNGTWSKQYDEYFITTIFGRYTNGPKYYWTIYVNNIPASSGPCEIALHRGDALLFVPTPYPYPDPLGDSAPTHAQVGTPFRVHVVYHDAKGVVHPLKGAQVGGALTNRYGNAWITPHQAGTLVLQAKKSGYVRAQPLKVTVTA